MPLAPIPPNDAAAPTKPRAVLLPLKNLLAEFDAQAALLYESKRSGLKLGPETGFPTLDAALSGALLPGLHFAMGVPGVGKTAFALQVASSCGCPCLYLTCEMRPLELLRRVTARATKTYLNKFKDGTLSPADASVKVRRAVATAEGLVLLDGTAAYADAEAIMDGVEATRKAAPDNPHFLLVVDSLHAWCASAPGDSQEYERLAAHLSALKRVSSLLNCPVLVIAERNRQSMEKGGLSSGAGHRGIEYASETVIELDMEKDVTEDAYGFKPVKLKISKNRNGQPGKTFALKFHGGFQTYAEAGASDF